jgi:uncharacterized membrane protein
MEPSRRSFLVRRAEIALDNLIHQGFPYLGAITSFNLKGAIVPESNRSGLSDNAAGAIAYITFVPAIVFLVLPPYNARPYVRFHSWQSIYLNIAAIVVLIALSLVIGFGTIFGASLVFLQLIPWFFWLFWILLWVSCAVSALNGRRFKLPWIGTLASSQANK